MRIVISACLVFALAGCGTSESAPSDAGPGSATDSGSCGACTVPATCGGSSICTQLTGDTFCLRACPLGTECSAGDACMAEADVNGAEVKVCVPQTECGLVPSQGDGGVAPVPFDGGGGFDGGVVGSIGPDGGTLSRLYFAAVGDTRGLLPLKSSYPTDVITTIYTSIEALSPRPPFVVSSGDYAFTLGTDTSAQLDLYLGARAKYSGALFPAMGNHECTYATNSNCGAGNANGMAPAYTAFLAKMLAPIGKPDPYYTIPISAADGSWTAKFVFVAPNAWTAAQGTWLESELSKPTTYTFLMRHEPASANTAPGVDPTETIFSAHPYTLIIVGHTHTYSHTGREVMFGNGGAPKTGTKGWGFGVFAQRPDGAIQVDEIDYASGLADSSFRFAVKADGSPAP